MNDIEILKVFSKRGTWERYSSYVKEHNVTKETFVILKCIDEYYTSDTTRLEIEWETFSTWFKVVKNSGMKPETIELYQKIFENIKTSTDTSVTEDIIAALTTKDYLTRIADIALRGAEGTAKTTIEDIIALTDEYEASSSSISGEDFIINDDIHGLIEHVSGGNGLDWRLEELNVSLGPLRKGDFITITARPDSGKTTMLAAESSFMAPQLTNEQCVLWFNNEEEGRKVKFRIIQAAIGWTTKDILANPIKAYAEYEKTVGHLKKILVYDRPSFSVRDVTAVLKDYNPGLIIFDQLRKVKGFEKEGGNDVGRLQLLFQQAREWAKEYAPVINVHQARGDAEGQRWIELNQMHGSQTDIQGEVDAIIALGRTHEPGLEYSRFIYTPKNKLSGGPKSNEKYRNGKWEVEIQPEIARFRGAL